MPKYWKPIDMTGDNQGNNGSGDGSQSASGDGTPSALQQQLQTQTADPTAGKRGVRRYRLGPPTGAMINPW